MEPSCVSYPDALISHGSPQTIIQVDPMSCCCSLHPASHRYRSLASTIPWCCVQSAATSLPRGVSSSVVLCNTMAKQLARQHCGDSTGVRLAFPPSCSLQGKQPDMMHNVSPCFLSCSIRLLGVRGEAPGRWEAAAAWLRSTPRAQAHWAPSAAPLHRLLPSRYRSLPLTRRLRASPERPMRPSHSMPALHGAGRLLGSA